MQKIGELLLTTNRVSTWLLILIFVSMYNEKNEGNIVSKAWRKIWSFILFVVGLGALILILGLLGPLFLLHFNLDMS